MDDVLTFAEEDPSSASLQGSPWKILIADDEPSVHLVTRLALGDFTFEGRRLELLSAYGEADTRKLLQEHPDIALMLLDVVMDTITSGFDLVRYVRDELKNHDVRIIMRTGQSGNAPEDRIIINYDINDFKDKTELTVAKLRTTMISSLRTYSHLRIIEEEQRKAATHRVYLSSIINSLSSFVATLDSELRVVLWNHQAELWTGHKEAQAEGKSLFELAPMLAPFQELCRSVLGSGHGVERPSVPLQHERFQHVQLSIRPLSGGPNPEILFRLDDRTEAKKHNEQLVRSQKLSTFTSLASGFTQEMDRLLGQLETRLEDEHASDDVLKLGRQARHMLDQVVRFARTPSRAPQRFDLGELVARKIASTPIPEGITVRGEGPGIPVPYDGSPEDWELVMDSLTSNALDAMTWVHGAEALKERSMTWQLKQRRSGDGLFPQRTEFEGGTWWEFGLRDTGVGMSEEVVSQAMDPYFTTKPRDRGTGLGLSLVYSVVDLHGGVVDLQSRPGQGTLVTLALPAAQDLTLPPQRDTGLVLLCDDEPLMRQVTGKILKKMGYTVVEAPDGSSAIELFLRHQSDLVLVILDMILPGKTGLEVFREIHALNPQIPVLLSSGFGRGETVERALEEGVAAFLQKPFGFESLGQAVRRAVGR